MIDKTDEEIALQVQRGDTESFGQLVQRYEQKITRYARRFFSSAPDVEDLAQEVFIKAFVNIRSFDSKRKFSPWIYRLAHNEFVNALKKKSRDKVYFFDLDVLLPHPVAKEKTDTEVNNQSLRQMLDRCLNQLDAKYRELLVLYFFEELNYQEIADVLQIPVSTVGVRLLRGKEQLKKLVSKLDSTYGSTK